MVIFTITIILVVIGVVLGIVAVSSGFDMGITAIGFSITTLVVVLLGNGIYSFAITKETEDLVQTRVELVEALSDSPDNKYINEKVIEFNDDVIENRKSVDNFSWTLVATNQFDKIELIDIQSNNYEKDELR